ncbi:hypothetical protein A4H97_10165 [Niastella yeongjuensis]|uniref:Uncharacterized protein n=1 Tax=Niastella yeongjuensis TaxID=354355 RepID=A0A1V9EF12_9BACT|nr:hypothetical protein [Niastella yeongjuensis]OQP44718.1 hypothetical protein A4H97_10165 [Niastella yeongjuensis]SEO77774.1 hypothetical protein SAMN05660816_03507 [Niastella yeongjuensis]
MKLKLLDYREVPDLPVGSNVEFFNDTLYLVDDDASDLVTLKKWQVQAKHRLLGYDDPKILPGTKSDFEATTIVVVNSIPRLLVMGFDIKDQHHKAILVNLDDLTKEEYDISVFYNRLKETVGVINIESAAIVLGKLILCNRDHKSAPEKHIIVTDADFWKNQANAEITTVSFDLPQTPKQVVGLSGLAYSYKNDWLIVSLLSESADKDHQTTGDSYLAVIENASRKVVRKKMKVNSLFHLNEANNSFTGFNMQSVCIRADKSRRVKLYLLADNKTAGKNGIFSVRIKE